MDTNKEKLSDQAMEINIPDLSDQQTQTHINDLPDVVLEYIFSLLSPYDELLNCRLVCKAWYQLTYCALHKIKLDFKSAIKNLNIQWNKYTSNGGIDGPNISGRYSHSCCLHSQYMYIFGGCTYETFTRCRYQESRCTTFNDLWIFDLNEKTWNKPLTSGQYPPPKSCVSMVSYRNKLYLFGGWTNISAFPSVHKFKLFQDLHEFDIAESKWTLLQPINKMMCPPMAGHSASVIGNQMLIYGGLFYSPTSSYDPLRVNSDIYIYNFDTNEWSRKEFHKSDGPIPPARYGHSQIVLNEHNIAVIGGCSDSKILYNDIWILKMDTEKWCWIKVNIESNDLVNLPIFGFHQVVKVDDMILFLSNICSSCNKISGLESQGRKVFRSNEGQQAASSGSSNYSNSSIDTKNNNPSTSRLKSQPKHDIIKKEFLASINNPNQRQLENSDKVRTNDEIKVKPQKSHAIRLSTIRSGHSHKPYNNPMFLHVIDFSKALTHHKATWLNQVRRYDGPDEIFLYSLIAATNELVLFGGIEKQVVNHGMSSDRKQEIFSNSVYIASARNFII